MYIIIRFLCVFTFVFALGCSVAFSLDQPARFVDEGEDGRLVYDTYPGGDRITDFSHAGYGGGGVEIPDVPVKAILTPGVPGSDDGLAIQSAIDYVSGLPADASGWRGAVGLAPGEFHISGSIKLHSSGVVLRGSGRNEGGTTLIATGTDRRSLIEIKGSSNLISETPLPVSNDYVPVGSNVLQLESAEGLLPGDEVLVTRPSPSSWIEFMGMGAFPGRPAPHWKPDTMDLVWHRIILDVDSQTIHLDAPITCSLDSEFGRSTVQKIRAGGLIRQLGVENLHCLSESDASNPKDENHAWMAVSIDYARDVWVRNVTASHFVSSAVAVWENGSRVTVMDCRSESPVSEVAGYRRHAFYTAGQQTLFLRCFSENGRHDFSAGWKAPGPNVFLHCESQNALDFSGPIESWATGVLYDNLIMDGGGLHFDNREIWDNGVGWAAANCVAWQCSVPVIISRTPPGAHNWVIGCWAQFSGDGLWRSLNEFVDPDSLYEGQLVDRLGRDALAALEPDTASTVIQPGDQKRLFSASRESVRESLPVQPATNAMALMNGWLTMGPRLATGHQPGITWWRGHSMPSRAPEFGINLTRFVPGRRGQGLTDDLSELAQSLAKGGAVGLRHHPGLWYDRRRDDHQMIRRIDGNVWPPFYELPWARSGTGTAWDGLSLYDLTQFNPWYFDRLSDFADECATHGLVFLNAMYFQHNILEAGAHWADYPWRSINNINQTGFPEPPPYVNRKRIFMAEDFYDVSHPERRRLHALFINKCLDNLSAKSNVIHLLGEEFSGPLHFVRFWVDTVSEKIKGQPDSVSPLIGLSAPRDVQDAILNDPDRSSVIDVIDFKYWWISPKGVYAPGGGTELAPRQHERQWKGGRPTDETLALMASEYKARFPDKALISSFDKARWAWLCAGGSMPVLPVTTDPRLLAAIPGYVVDSRNTRPVDRQWALLGPGGGLVYAGSPESLTLDLSGLNGTLRVSEISQSNGRVESRILTRVAGGGTVDLSAELSRKDSPVVLWFDTDSR